MMPASARKVKLAPMTQDRVVLQAGAIAIRREGGEPRVLLVQSRQGTGDWIFPKGHVESGETLEQTALRELQEEAGVTGSVIGPAGQLDITFGGERMKVHYFLIVATSEGASSEARPKAWLSFDDALRRLSYDDARELLTANREAVMAASEP
jgi:8-oxo-dGTP pyrophosphatase MutT (NUDIX family)